MGEGPRSGGEGAIVFLVYWSIVLATIELNDYMLLTGAKICHIFTNNTLAVKRNSKKMPITQSRPKLYLKGIPLLSVIFSQSGLTYLAYLINLTCPPRPLCCRKAVGRVGHPLLQGEEE
jgi:hypothetical protein